MTNRDTKRLAFVLLFALLSLTLAACGDDPTGPETVVPPPPDTSLHLIFPDLQTSECGEVAVPITVQNFAAVSGIELRIGYDTLQTTFDSLSSSHVNVVYVGNTDGVVRFIWVDQTMIKPLSLNDNDTLLWFHCSGLSGTSSLTFEDPVYVTDTAGTHLTLELIDGSMTCTSR